MQPPISRRSLCAALAGAALGLPAWAAAAAGQKAALVIGNANYRVGVLKNPVNDARAMAARLKAAGYPDSDLHIIVDPAHPREGNLVAVLRR